MTDDIFSPGDKVILHDASGTKGYYKQGETAVVDRQVGDRLWVIFDSDELKETISGHIRRFRKVTKLDKALR